MIKVTQNRFDGGMVTDPISEAAIYAQVIKNFNIHHFPHRLVPSRNFIVGDSNAATDKIQNFCVALYSGSTDFRAFGLGVVSGGTKAKVFVNNSLISNTWSALVNGASGTGTSTNFNLFVYYAKTGKIYGARDGTNIWNCDPTGSAAFVDTATSDTPAITYTNIVQGLVHPDDDILYIGYDNFVASNNNGTWNTTALTLPKDRVVTSLSTYGKMLAIATRNINSVGKSIVYLWDKTSVSWSETIDWGEGNIQVLEELDGVLVGISIAGTTTSILFSRIVFRQYAGGAATVFNQFVSEAVYLANDLAINKQKINNALYFLMTVKLSGTTQQGLWKVAKPLANPNYAVVFDRAPNNDTALVAGTLAPLAGFIINGDVVHIAYTSNDVYGLSVTDSSTNYTATSIFESIINPGIPATHQLSMKQLMYVKVFFLPFTGSEQVVAKYRVDSTGSYSTIFTKTSSSPDSGITFYKSKQEGSGRFTRGYQYQFRLESTNGAIITGYEYGFNELPS